MRITIRAIPEGKALDVIRIIRWATFLSYEEAERLVSLCPSDECCFSSPDRDADLEILEGLDKAGVSYQIDDPVERSKIDRAEQAFQEWSADFRSNLKQSRVAFRAGYYHGLEDGRRQSRLLKETS